MLVREVMSPEPVTVAADATLREAVERMLRERVGSVLLTRDGDPAGILTETDALRGAYRAERSLAAVPAAAAATEGLVTVPPTATTRRAVELMRDDGVKKLVVTEGLDAVGVVTTTDLAHNQPALLREAHEIESGRGDWEPGE
ncbi:CBS domain-containing protein [Halorarum halobium]|uniref:CBS domain-containing protein n=1 Tax=Halorarum halobium TaxID=3075121 RepID=UPI0028A90D60|nr:CBS domain-containing protein [Halobaculum sp. XH14]